MIKIIKDNFNFKTFNKTAVHPLQSWEWGEARKKMGIKVLRIGDFKKDKLENVYQITFHQIPYTPFNIGYLPRSNFPSKKILNFLTNFGKKNKTIFIKIEPYVYKKEFKNITINQFNNLKSSPHPMFPRWTIILDLTKSEEELLKNMKPKTRYNIRLAQKKGVVIKEESNNKGFETFSKLYFKTCQRQKYYGHNLKYHQTIWQSLKTKFAYILTAYYKNIPLSSYEIFIFNNVLYYPYGGSSSKYRNLMASNLLMWEVIKFGIKKGAKKFDMWGSLAPNYDKKNPWSGFTRFKEGYGGQFIEFIGSYDLVIHPRLYFVYNEIFKIRSFVLKNIL